MEILVFKTDIKSKRRIERVEWIFNQHPYIADWSVDLQDVDKVLRVEARSKLKEDDVIDIIRTFGYTCEVLPD
ncbi:MAG: hypothetical protein ABJF04_22445 [Reichenbachiella sp.]|uniref:hypothetical protein n=1 Tax=Reichenbachiella sp. TaxID=2184521 RepID=UPI003267636E